MDKQEKKENVVESRVYLYTVKGTSEIKEEPSLNLKSKRFCRVCYCDDKEVDSALLNPCNCLGGVKYIHFSCLQQWLKSRCVTRSVSNENCMMYTVKQMECEICKAILPDVVKYRDRRYEIYEFVKPNFKSWISIETLTANHTLKTLYIINLDKKDTIKIGRSHDSDLRITDISVSRFHAQINIQSDNTLRIEDNNSKFGSLVLVQVNSLPIVVEPTLCLQIGRSVIFAHLKPPWKIFSCFSCSGGIQKVVDYTRINTGHINIEKVLSVKIQIDKDDLDESLVLSNKKEELQEIREENDNISNDNILTSNNENEDNVEQLDYIDNPNILRNHDQLNNLNIVDNNPQNQNIYNNTEINLNEAEVLNSVRLISNRNLNGIKLLPEDEIQNKIKDSPNFIMNKRNNESYLLMNPETTLVKSANQEKKFNTIIPNNKFTDILGQKMEIDREKLNIRRSEIHKSSHLEKLIQQSSNDDLVLNINNNNGNNIQKKTKQNFSTQKINIDSFKRYEEDSNKYKNNEFLTMVPNISQSSRNLNIKLDSNYKDFRKNVNI